MTPDEPHEQAEAGADVFISYSRKDGEFVRRLYDALRAHDRSAWVDWEGIPPSAKWMEELRGAIGAAQAFVFVISPDAVASDVCREELDYAASLNKRIIPIVVREPGSADGVPEPATVRNWIFFRETDDFDGSLAALEETLDTEPEWAREHTRLLVRAVEWEANDRDPSFALRGRDLTSAETWLTEADERKDPQPTRLHTEYIVASRGAATRTQRRRMVALGTALVITAVLAVLAFLQFRRAEDEAQVAQSRELAASSELALERNPDLALTLAVEAAKVDETPESTRALRQALEATYVQRELAGDGDAMTATAASPDGELTATGDSEGGLTVWNVADGSQAAAFDAGAEVNTVAFDPEGTKLVAAAGDRAVVFTLDESEEPIFLDGHRAKVWSASFDPAGRRLVTAGGDGSARVWTAHGQELAAFEGHPKAVYTAAFAPDGSTVASGGREDGFLRIWDAGSGKELERLPVEGRNLERGQQVDVNAVVFDPSGRRVLSGAGDGIARLHAIDSAKSIALKSGQQEVYGVAFDPQGDFAATGSLDGKVRVWDVSDAKPVPARTLLGHTGGVNSVAFVPGGRSVISASNDGTARVWEATGDDSTLTLRGHDQGVVGVAVADDGRTAATTSLDETARIWDLESGEELGSFQATLDVWSPALSPDGANLLVGVGDGTAQVLDTVTGRELARFSGHRFRVVGADLSPDGTLAVTTSLQAKGGAQSWDAESGEPIADFAGHDDYVFSAELSPDGEQALTAGADRTARLWDPQTGDELGALEGHTDWVRDARFSPDGSRIVTGSEDATARVWDAETFAPLQTLRGHEEGVLGASFSPDGERIATASSDRTVRVWDADSGELLDTLEGHEDWVNDLAFTPEGDVLTASYDNTAKLMVCQLCLSFPELLELAEARVTYELTPEERDQYLHE